MSAGAATTARMMYDPVVEEPMPMMMETSVTRQSAINRFPCEKSISTAENLRPSPARMMPPMMTPRVPMAAPAEVLLWAPPTSPFSTSDGTILVALWRHDSTAAETVPPNAQNSDRQSSVEGKSVTVRVDHGGRRISKNKTKKIN